MPSEIMDKRRFSLFSEELRFPTESQVGFWKTESVPDHQGEGMALMSGSHAVSSSLLGKLQPVGPSTMESSELLQPDPLKDQKIKFNMENHLVGARNGTSPSVTSWRGNGHNSVLKSKLSMRPFSTEGNKVDMSGLPYENGLFSSSLSELLDRRLNLSSNIAFLDQSVGTINSNFEEEELLEPLEEIEAQTIGNLLPDDDDLLSGVIDDFGYIAQPNCGDDIDDDIFCTGGGMELGGDENSLNASDLINGGGSNGLQGGLNSQFPGEHQYGEQPSRTLFVRNINIDVEDSELKVLFEQYGDIRTLYTTCKHRGFVMISYYDIRAAKNAMRSLQSKPLRRRKLDIHYSIPKVNPSEKDINQGRLAVFNIDSSVSNDVLHQIFGVYGEIKEICETPHKQHHKFIEFYDVRDAEAARHALNGTDIAGNKIYLEPSHPSGARWCLSNQISPGLEQEASSAYKQGHSPSSSPPGIFGSLPHGAITSGFNNAVGAPIRPLLDSTFNGISLSVPHKLSSPVDVSSVGYYNNPSGHGENGSSLGQMKLGFQNVPVMHPHSLPEYHDGLTSGITYNSSNTMSAMAMNFSCRPGEGIDNRYIQGVGSGSLTSPSFESAFGAPGNGSCPVHGRQYIWKNAKACPHPSSGPMIWGNSPPFINNIPSLYPPQLHRFPGAPSHMLNAVLPMHPHHVGSAPTVNPSIWERRQPYIGDPTDIPSLHPGSLGNMGFSGTSPMHPLELAARNIIDHVGILSPQQRSRIFQGRNHMIPMLAPFDVPNDRIRSRRSDSSANQVDNKKQYELDIEQIIRGEDSRTTLMIKNIPNKYTSKMLLAAIDEHHKGSYDFIYLPIDFKNKCNVGYAFINMIDPHQIIPFFQAFNGKKWEKFNSEKVASLAYARIQGKAALIAHFQNSSLMNEDKRCRPILFHSDGPNAGDQVSSAVPEGKGVSSSAAVEVATMSAIAAAYGLNINPRDLALLCQKVENHIVGAPCGVMDQMTSACGESNKLLAMVCQPAEVKELVAIPTHIRFWGIDSGIRHSVGGTDYGSVRIGTFMGRKIITSEATALLSRSLPTANGTHNDMNYDECEEHGIELVKAEASLDYLCNLSVHRYEAVYSKKLPEYILGDSFLNKYADHSDTVTTIDPKRQYAVKAPTKHPIYEKFRVEAFKALLTAATTEEQLSTLGELMYQCHYSYNDCGLGSIGTDRLVNLVQETQHRHSCDVNNSSLFGAKITGGGSGGSVCVIGKNCIRSSEEIIEIQQRYHAATGYLPVIFEGSSPGAGKFGYLKLRRKQSKAV